MYTFFDPHLNSTFQEPTASTLTGQNPTGPDVLSFVGGGGKTTTMFRLASEIAKQGRRVMTTTTTHIGPGQIQHAPSYVKMSGDELPIEAIAQAFTESNHCLLISDHATERKVSGVSPALVDQLAECAPSLGIAAILVEADGARKRPLKAPRSYEPPLPQSTTLLLPVMGLDALGCPITDEYVHRPEEIRALLGVTDGSCHAETSPTSRETSLRITPQMAAQLLTDPNGGGKNRPPQARLMPILNKVDTAPRLAGARLIAQEITKRGYHTLITAVGTQPTKPVIERHAPMTTVLLAAGAGRRMGQAKQLLTVDGKPDGESMVVRAARTALQSHTEQVVVVTGAYAEEVAGILASLKEQVGERLQLVHNPDWETGQASSVKSALEALPAHMGAAIFLPIDQPFIPAHLLTLLRRRWQEGAAIVAPMLDGKLRGAPALFSRHLWPALMTLEGDQGARPLLQKYAATIAPIPAQSDWLQDVDTPEAYRDAVLKAN